MKSPFHELSVELTEVVVVNGKYTNSETGSRYFRYSDVTAMTDDDIQYAGDDVRAAAIRFLTEARHNAKRP